MNWIRQARKFRMALGLPPIFKSKAAAQPKKTAAQPKQSQWKPAQGGSSRYIDALKRGLLGWGEVETWVWTPDHWNVSTPKDNPGETTGKTTGEARFIEKDKRLRGLDWPLTGTTMVGWKRLTQWEESIYHCLDAEVPGAFVETGVWRGGGLILAAAILAEQQAHDRQVWGFDSFEGLPVPNPADYPGDADVFDLSGFAALAVAEEEVRKNFERWGVPDGQVTLVKGWFKDTLASSQTGPIAALRLDGDYYESTIQALEALEPRVSAGGIVIIDDYHAFPQCAQAVHDYRARNEIDFPMHEIDGTAVFWTKAHQSQQPVSARTQARRRLYDGDQSWLAQLRDRTAETIRISQAQQNGSLQRYDWINAVIEKRGFQNYLEIGVRNPADCFDRVRAANKTSVDPGHEFAENPVDFPLTSDDFFAALEAGSLDGLDPAKRWDVIFIDGLHQADQVDRDIRNARNHITPNGMIVLHDCLPPNEHFAHNELEEAVTLENGGSWNGSTWRAFYKHWLQGDAASFVIDADWGIGVIDLSAPCLHNAPPHPDWGLDSLRTYKAVLSEHTGILTPEAALEYLEKPPGPPPTGRPHLYWEQTTKPFTGKATDTLSKLMYNWAGKSLHKWEHYAAHCDAHLAEWRGRAPRLMEIGVQNGGSLELWNAYFGEGMRIAGVDVDPACASLDYPPHIQVFIGDQTHSPTLHRALAHLGGAVDIIIDDGSHKSPDVRATFRELWPHLTVGGWYVIEDLHASYWRDYSSAYGHPESIMAFLAELADDLHGAHHTSGHQHTPWSSLGAIHVYDSIAFIQKTEREMPRNWRMPPVPSM